MNILLMQKRRETLPNNLISHLENNKFEKANEYIANANNAFEESMKGYGVSTEFTAKETEARKIKGKERASLMAEYTDITGHTYKNGQKASTFDYDADGAKGKIAILKNSIGSLKETLDSGDLASAFESAYNTPSTSGSGTPRSELEKLEDLLGAINKEYVQMIEHSKEGLKGIADYASYMNENYFNAKSMIYDELIKSASNKIMKDNGNLYSLAELYDMRNKGSIDDDT